MAEFVQDVIVTSSAKLGVGTSLPQAGLHLASGFSPALRIYNTSDETTDYECLEAGWSLVAADNFEIRTRASGSGTAHNLRFYYGGTSSLAIQIPTSNTSSIILSSTNVTSSTNRVHIGNNQSNSSTSGTSNTLLVNDNFNPSATSTMLAVGVGITPTINFSAGTPGSGRYEALRIAVTETALPTGNNCMIRCLGGTGAITEVFSVRNTGATLVTLGTITSTIHAYDSTATWDSGSTQFIHEEVTITDTNSAPTSLLVDWKVGTSSRFSVNAKCGRFPDPRAVAWCSDEFTNGAAVSGQLGDMGWTTTGTVAFTTPPAARPGTIRLTTGTTSGNVAGIIAPGTASRAIMPSGFFDEYWIIRTLDITSCTIRFGLTLEAVGTAQPTDGIYFEYVAATDTNWQGVCRASSAQTRVDAGVAATNSTWIRARVRRIDSSTIGFSINEGTEVTITTNVPTGAMNFWATVQTNTAAARTLDIDYFDCFNHTLGR